MKKQIERFGTNNFIALLNAIEFLKKQIEPFNSYTLIYTPLRLPVFLSPILVSCVSNPKLVLYSSNWDNP